MVRGLRAHAIVSVVAALLLASCAAGSDYRDPFVPLRGELAAYEPDVRSDTPTIRARYHECVGDSAGVIHDTWGYRSLDGTMAVHVWRRLPSDVPPRGTVLLVHGYVALPCELEPVIERLLADGYVVLAPELPGHGLSDGARADIESFADYGRFLVDLDPILSSLPHPHDVVAHSTGASAVIERLRTDGDPYDRIVLLAPLVRSRGYRATRVARAISRPFVSTVPARNAERFGFERIPLHWFDSLVEWNRTLDRAPRPFSDRELLIVQGRSDTVVAWRYNVRVLGDLLPMAEVREIPALGHVPSSREEAGRTAIDEIAAYLEAPRR